MPVIIIGPDGTEEYNNPGNINPDYDIPGDDNIIPVPELEIIRPDKQKEQSVPLPGMVPFNIPLEKRRINEILGDN